MRPFIIAIAFMFALWGAPASAQQEMFGQWRGVGLQNNPDETWPIELTLESDGSGTISYPSLSCGGELSRERTRGGVTFYREHITRGVGRCVDGGLAGVYPHGGRLMWFWTAEDTEFPDMTASAVLERETPIS
jgi:hypothetical protein